MVEGEGEKRNGCNEKTLGPQVTSKMSLSAATEVFCWNNSHIHSIRCRADVCDYVQACMKVLIDHGVPGSIFVAIKKGWAEKVAALIASNADINLKDAVCTTSLLLPPLITICVYFPVYVYRSVQIRLVR